MGLREKCSAGLESPTRLPLVAGLKGGGVCGMENGPHPRCARLASVRWNTNDGEARWWWEGVGGHASKKRERQTCSEMHDSRVPRPEPNSPSNTNTSPGVGRGLVT
jgi:hypothetical protein